jgi:type 1 glutamine amidotransferase
LLATVVSGRQTGRGTRAGTSAGSARKSACATVLLSLLLCIPAWAQRKHIVLIAGDQEYRSEESIPALAQILAKRGFQCTVLYSTNRSTGEIDPSTIDNIPGLEALRRADLMVMFMRWLELPDEQTREIIDYTNAGKPIVALRTSTHPFHYVKHLDSPFAKYDYASKDPAGGYGRMVIGETWVRHWGRHQQEATRGVPADGMESHPILRGVKDVFGESDVYEITTLSGDSKPILMGQVLSGMSPDAAANAAKKMMPVAWIKTYSGARVFGTTMGHANDFKNEGFRRMVVNGCYWALGMDDKISPTASVAFVGAYDPNPIGVNKQKKDLKPAVLP